MNHPPLFQKKHVTKCLWKKFPNTFSRNSFPLYPLSVCLSYSLNLDLRLSIFWLSACEQAGCRDFAFVGVVESSSSRLRHNHDASDCTPATQYAVTHYTSMPCNY